MTTRIAMIGCGSVARRSHLPAFKKADDVEVVAFASRSRSSAETAATECGTGRPYDDWRKIIDLDDVDAVDICSPNAFHREQAVAAARAGKHVLVEKPMATTTDEADEMIEAAKEAGVVLHVAHNLRYLPAVAAARAASGRVGNVSGVRHAFGHSGPRDWAPDSTWFFNPELSGGGALIDLGIHAIDLVRFVTGLDVSEVSAMTFGSEPAEDAAHVLMRFSTGAIGFVHASWVARPAPDFAFAVFGTEGTLQLSATSPLTLRNASGGSEEIALPEITSNPYLDFVTAVRGGTNEAAVAPAGGADGRAALAVVCAAYESARTGRTVEIVQ